VDVTATSQLSFTVDYGTTFADGFPYVEFQRNMGNGAAVGDYDGDGDLDVYLLGMLGHPNKLFRNNLDQGPKTFTDVTTAPLDDTGLSRVASFVDLNNDGLLDLVLLNDDDGSPNYGRSRIFRNDGGGSFTDVTAGSGFRPVGYLHCGMSIADFDGDGLLDLYVTNWGFDDVLPPPSPLPGSNHLYKNLGNFRFTDVTTTVGLGILNRFSFSAVFTDYNGDFLPDLHILLDGSSDEFYWNNGGSFSNATVAVGATHTGNDMGVAVADFDDDGDLDMFQTNITDALGNFGFTQYNAFYINHLDTTGKFVDEAVARGVEDSYWGWGTQFVDVEQDGDLDIVAVTGFDEWIELSSPGHPLVDTPSTLYVNDGNGNFSRLLGAGLDAPLDSRALISFDYDRDGDQDLLITNVDEPVALLENVSTDPGNWLTVRLKPDRLAVGGAVFATTGATERRRDIIAGRSYLAGTPSEVHFGLGAETTIDELRVVWANGDEETRTNVSVNQLLDIAHASPVPAVSGVARIALGLAGLVSGMMLIARRGGRSGSDEPPDTIRTA
jgi:hypothetical protein